MTQTNTTNTSESQDWLSVNPDTLAATLLAVLENPHADAEAKKLARDEFRRILRAAASHETFMNS